MSVPEYAGCQMERATIAATLSPRDYYDQMDKEINEAIGVDIGWTGLIASRPYPMDESTLQGFRSRYSLIKTFQEQTLALFRASLNQECDPEIAQMVVGELPDTLGIPYHRQLTDRQHRTPVFFRTDEVASGKLFEVQCCGSGWCLAEQIRQLYCDNERVFGAGSISRTPWPPPSPGLSRGIWRRAPYPSPRGQRVPAHGMRYFIQRTRRQGARYFSYDRGVSPADCNFVRSHDFITLPHHNFFADRMERCNQGQVFFDLPPSNLFDGKIILAWPFWEKTRSWYSDEVRSLFPHAGIIRPDGIELEGGERISLEEFCRIPQRKREFYIKYAGTDINMNWGSKSVYLASTFSQVQCRKLLDTILADGRRHRHWIVQRAIRQKETASVVSLEAFSLTPKRIPSSAASTDRMD